MRAREQRRAVREGCGERSGGGGGTSPLRKLCAHSKDRFKVYGRRIIPFIVLVNPGIYTPRRSSPTPVTIPRAPPPTHPSTRHSCVGKPGWCFNPFPFYERLLRARAPCRARLRADMQVLETSGLPSGGCTHRVSQKRARCEMFFIAELIFRSSQLSSLEIAESFKFKSTLKDNVQFLHVTFNLGRLPPEGYSLRFAST